MAAFTKLEEDFVKADAHVLGVSIDSFAANGVFQKELGCEFPIASDWPKYQTGRDYEVLNEDMGFHNRVTFVIDGTGVIRDSNADGRDFEGHAPRSLEVAQSLS